MWSGALYLYVTWSGTLYLKVMWSGALYLYVTWSGALNLYGCQGQGAVLTIGLGTTRPNFSHMTISPLDNRPYDNRSS